MSTLPTAITGAAARPSRIRVALTRVGQVILHVWHARQNRREVSDLLRFDDRTLKDIGLTRSDVIGVLSGSSVVDPSIGLRLRRGETRGQPHAGDAQVLRVKQLVAHVPQDTVPRLAA